MQRIVIAVVLSGLLAACGQQSGAKTEAGTPVGDLDYIDAVPIDESAPPPVVEPEPVAKKDEPEAETKADEADAPETAAPAAPPSPEPAVKADDAAAATRRANETTATPYETTPRAD